MGKIEIEININDNTTKEKTESVVSLSKVEAVMEEEMAAACIAAVDYEKGKIDRVTFTTAASEYRKVVNKICDAADTFWWFRFIPDETSEKIRKITVDTIRAMDHMVYTVLRLHEDNEDENVY